MGWVPFCPTAHWRRSQRPFQTRRADSGTECRKFRKQSVPQSVRQCLTWLRLCHHKRVKTEVLKSKTLVNTLATASTRKWLNTSCPSRIWEFSKMGGVSKPYVSIGFIHDNWMIWGYSLRRPRIPLTPCSCGS